MVAISNSCGNANSEVALLTVVADLDPPSLGSIGFDCLSNKLCLTFSEPVPLEPNNYFIDGGAGPFVIDATYGPSQSVVCLSFDAPLSAASHSLDFFVQDFC